MMSIKSLKSLNVNINLDAITRLFNKPVTKTALTPQTRGRLEVAFTVVATAAVIVGLSGVVRPDPAKLALAAQASITMPTTSVPDRPYEPISRLDGVADSENVDPAFISAVARGDIPTMEKLYRKEMPKSEMLSAAAESGDTATVEWVLAHGADIHEAEDTPHAPVLMADEHAGVVSLLLARGAREPSLAAAAQAGAANSVDRLLAMKRPVNPSTESPLSSAVASTRMTGDTKKRVIEKLFAAGADPNRTGAADDGTSFHALTTAARACEPNTDLVDYPVQLDTPEDCIPIIRLLVRHGAHADGDTLMAALSPATALHEAARDRIADAILAARLEPGATATVLSQMNTFLTPSTMKKVIAKGVDWGWRDGEDEAALPLITAVRARDYDTVRVMLENGAPAGRVYKYDQTALSAAIDALSGDDSPSDARMIELLIAHGADVNRRHPDGRTPLFAAAEVGDVKTIHVLLDHGARVNEVVLDDTALNAAEQSGHVSAARVLHARGGRRAR